MEEQKLKNHDAMFYIQMKWNIAERMSFDDMWDMQIKESEQVDQDVIVH